MLHHWRVATDRLPQQSGADHDLRRETQPPNDAYDLVGQTQDYENYSEEKQDHDDCGHFTNDAPCNLRDVGTIRPVVFLHVSL